MSLTVLHNAAANVANRLLSSNDSDKATMPQLSLSFNIDALSSVAGQVNLAPETTVQLARDVFDYTDPFEGKLDLADRNLTFRVGTGSQSSDAIDVNIGSLTLNALGLDDSAIDSLEGANSWTSTSPRRW